MISEFNDHLWIHAFKLFNGVKSKLLSMLFQSLHDLTSICLPKSKFNHPIIFPNVQTQLTTFCIGNYRHFKVIHLQLQYKSYSSFKFKCSCPIQYCLIHLIILFLLPKLCPSLYVLCYKSGVLLYCEIPKDRSHMIFVSPWKSIIMPCIH